jgi:hypothetical protein
MRRRAAAWLAWSLCALSLVMFVATVVLYFLTLSVQPPSSWGTEGLSAVLIFLLPFLAFPVVGALIASRRPNNPIGWICLAVGILWMFANLTSGYGTYGLLVARPGSVPFPAAIGSLGEWMWAPALGLLGTYLILLFPDGRLPSRRWRPLAWFSGAVIISVSLTNALRPGRLPGLGGVPNPFGLEEYPWMADVTQAVTLLLPLCFLASALSLVLRFLRSGGEQREQVKWIAFAASFVGLVALITVVSTFRFAPESLETGTQPLWLELLQDVELLSLAGVPVAVGFAILKHRLYDIDVVINRTLVYGSLTAMLAAVYFGGVATIQALFRTLTSQEQQPQLAIVISTLVIAALFNPLRRRIQSFVDRRFYRRKYDAAKTLEAFSAKLRDETDLEALNAELVGVVRETMQPAHVSLWLRPDTASKGKRADSQPT